MRKIFISSLIAVVVMVSLYFVFRESFDRFNPWMEQEYVYVELQEDPVDDDGRYKYREQGVTASGKEKSVVFSSSTRLEQGTLVKVLAKGSYTVEYQLIQEDEMPTH